MLEGMKLKLPKFDGTIFPQLENQMKFQIYLTKFSNARRELSMRVSFCIKLNNETKKEFLLYN